MTRYAFYLVFFLVCGVYKGYIPLCLLFLCTLPFATSTHTNRVLIYRNKAVVGYLKAQGYSETAASMEAECETPTDSDAKFDTLLEKKWTAIVRLQKKVRDPDC